MYFDTVFGHPNVGQSLTEVSPFLPLGNSTNLTTANRQLSVAGDLDGVTMAECKGMRRINQFASAHYAFFREM